MLGIRKVTKRENTEYATSSDFCWIFARDTERLYLLSFLLTGDEAMAEKCFVAGFEDSVKGNAVFKEWAQSWARRTIIQNAIRMIQPRPGERSALDDAQREIAIPVLTERPEIAAVVALPAFERCVFVISVLEGYSVQNCSLLLGCSRAEVIAARSHALQSIGNSAQVNHESLTLGRMRQPEADPDVVHQLKAISALPIPA